MNLTESEIDIIETFIVYKQLYYVPNGYRKWNFYSLLSLESMGLIRQVEIPDGLKVKQGVKKYKLTDEVI